MKNQVLFSFKDKNKKLKCRLLQFLFGTLRGKATSVSSAKTLITCCCVGFVMSQLNNKYLKDSPYSKPGSTEAVSSLMAPEDRYDMYVCMFDKGR